MFTDKIKRPDLWRPTEWPDPMTLFNLHSNPKDQMYCSMLHMKKPGLGEVGVQGHTAQWAAKQGLELKTGEPSTPLRQCSPPGPQSPRPNPFSELQPLVYNWRVDWSQLSLGGP